MRPISAHDGAEDEADQRWVVRLTLRARAEIDAATAFLADTAGDAQADAWQNGLLEVVGTLARFPARQPVVPEAAFFHDTIRHLIYRRYRGGPAWRLLFSLRESEEDGPTVFVLHVRHGAREPITAGEAEAIENAE